MIHATRSLSVVLFAVILVTPLSASAATFVVFGNSTGAESTATGTVTLNATTLNMSLTNTAPFDARITGIGFDLPGGSGNTGLNGFTGTSSSANFAFSDGNLGNVPQFNAAVLDFGYTTGPSGNFNGGSPNNGIDQSQTVTFAVTGNFAGFTEAQVAAALFVRYQRVGDDGEGSDVGRATINTTAVPEPATMILLGTGLLAAFRARKTARLE